MKYRRARPVAHVLGLFEVEEDRRPTGSLQFADTSKHRMEERLNTFNDPHSRRAIGEMTGIRPMPACTVNYGALEAMNRKKGVLAEEDGG